MRIYVLYFSDDEIDAEVDDEDDIDDFEESEAHKKRKRGSKFSIDFDTGDVRVFIISVAIRFDYETLSALVISWLCFIKTE